MNEKGMIFIIGFLLLVGLAIGTTKMQLSSEAGATEKPAAPAKVQLVQLEEDGRPDSITMGLLTAPPLQPASHVDRWNPKLHQDSCLACHGKPETGAPTPPDDHFYDQNPVGKIFRDNCVQCHGQQNETKTDTAFY